MKQIIIDYDDKKLNLSEALYLLNRSITSKQTRIPLNIAYPEQGKALVTTGERHYVIEVLDEAD